MGSRPYCRLLIFGGKPKPTCALLVFHYLQNSFCGNPDTHLCRILPYDQEAKMTESACTLLQPCFSIKQFEGLALRPEP